MYWNKKGFLTQGFKLNLDEPVLVFLTEFQRRVIYLLSDIRETLKNQTPRNSCHYNKDFSIEISNDFEDFIQLEENLVEKDYENSVVSIKDLDSH